VKSIISIFLFQFIFFSSIHLWALALPSGVRNRENLVKMQQMYYFRRDVESLEEKERRPQSEETERIWEKISKSGFCFRRNRDRLSGKDCLTPRSFNSSMTRDFASNFKKRQQNRRKSKTFPLEDNSILRLSPQRPFGLVSFYEFNSNKFLFQIPRGSNEHLCLSDILENRRKKNASRFVLKNPLISIAKGDCPSSLFCFKLERDDFWRDQQREERNILQEDRERRERESLIEVDCENSEKGTSSLIFKKKRVETSLFNSTLKKCHSERREEERQRQRRLRYSRRRNVLSKIGTFFKTMTCQNSFFFPTNQSIISDAIKSGQKFISENEIEYKLTLNYSGTYFIIDSIFKIDNESGLFVDITDDYPLDIDNYLEALNQNIELEHPLLNGLKQQFEKEGFKIKINISKKDKNPKGGAQFRDFNNGVLTMDLSGYSVGQNNFRALGIWIEIWRALKNEPMDNIFINSMYDVNFEELDKVLKRYASMVLMVDRDGLVEELRELEENNFLRKDFSKFKLVMGINKDDPILLSELIENMPTEEENALEYLNREKESIILLHAA